jgi:hypothetical protein
VRSAAGRSPGQCRLGLGHEAVGVRHQGSVLHRQIHRFVRARYAHPGSSITEHCGEGSLHVRQLERTLVRRDQTVQLRWAIGAQPRVRGFAGEPHSVAADPRNGFGKRRIVDQLVDALSSYPPAPREIGLRGKTSCLPKVLPCGAIIIASHTPKGYVRQRTYGRKPPSGAGRRVSLRPAASRFSDACPSACCAIMNPGSWMSLREAPANQGAPRMATDSQNAPTNVGATSPTDDSVLLARLMRRAEHRPPVPRSVGYSDPVTARSLRGQPERVRRAEALRRLRLEPDEPAFPRGAHVAPVSRIPTRPAVAIAPRPRERRSTAARRGAQRRATRSTSSDDPPSEPALPPPSRRPALRRRATTVAFRARLAGGLTRTILADATTDLSDAEREYVLARVPPFVRDSRS